MSFRKCPAKFVKILQVFVYRLSLFIAYQGVVAPYRRAFCFAILSAAASGLRGSLRLAANRSGELNVTIELIKIPTISMQIAH